METFVLVLVLASYFSNSMVDIPGYKSQELCQAAGEMFIKDRASTRSFNCIKGPKGKKDDELLHFRH